MFLLGRSRHALAVIVVGCCLALSGITAAFAAGGAYVVEDSEVDDAGSCKVETSASFASNRDFIGGFTPTCSVNAARPLEIAVPVQTLRDGGSWTSVVGLQAKTNFMSVEKGPVGVGLQGAAFLNPDTGRLAAAFVMIPVSFQVSEPFRVNVSGGWALENSPSRHFLAWGVGYEWKLAKSVMLIGEVFGFAGPGNNNPRAQTGLRFTPMSSFDIDVIYGRDLLGTRADWITLGFNLRF